MLKIFLILIFSCSTKKYEPDQFSSVLENKWFNEMKQLHKIINIYVSEVRNETRINFGMFVFLSNSDVFRKILQKSKNVKIIKPWKMFFGTKDQKLCLTMLENDLQHLKLSISPGIDQFMSFLHHKIHVANRYTLRNWKYLNPFKASKISATSKEHELFINNFTKADILARTKDDFDIHVERKILRIPKYIFIQNLDRKDFIEQRNLEKIKKLKYKNCVYTINGIFLENQDNFKRAFLIIKYGRWATFEENKYKWECIEFDHPWHVTFVMYKNTSE